MPRNFPHPDFEPVVPGDPEAEKIIAPVSRYIRNDLLPKLRARRHSSGEIPAPNRPADPLSDSAVFAIVTQSTPPEFEDADGKRHLIRAVSGG